MGNNNFLRSIQSALGSDFNLGLFISMAKKSIVWVVLFIFIAALSVILYLRYTNPVYQASSTLMLKSEKTAKLLGADNEFLALDRDEILREIQLIKATAFTKRVVEKLDFDISYYRKGRTKLISAELYPTAPFELEYDQIYNSSIYGTKINIEFYQDGTALLNYVVRDKSEQQRIRIGEYFENSYFSGKIEISNKEYKSGNLTGDYFFIINDSDTYASQIARLLIVSPINASTRTMEISYKDENQSKATDIVNTVSEEFRKYDLERKQESVNNILEFLQVQIGNFTEQLNMYQDSLKQFRLENNFLSPENEASNIFERLSKLEEQKEMLGYDLNIIDWYVGYIDQLQDLRMISPGLLEEQLSSSIQYVNTLIEL
ncbi:MAG: hypothetical protein WD334_05120, partial [Chitinophagales bacterium]